MKKNVWIIAAVLFGFLTALASAQPRTIRGKVTSAEDGRGIPGAGVLLKGTTTGTVTNASGDYSLRVPTGEGTLVFSFVGFRSQEAKLGISNVVNIALSADAVQLGEVARPTELLDFIDGFSLNKRSHGTPKSKYSSVIGPLSEAEDEGFQQPDWNTEEYNTIQENGFRDAMKAPLSTFSIDVDAASYSNVRRFIDNGQRPPVDAVRIEEMVNYFDYDYEQPGGEDPFSIYTEIGQAPWNTEHQLVHIGLQGKRIPTDNLPASNLVFLIDVSGSMSDPNKLPLLKASFKMLVEQLRPQDQVAIVVYAGAAGLVLPSTSGAEKKTIIASLERLEAGGSTAGGAGIQLAYAVAKENFKTGGNNRIVLATDGDFNIGESSNAGMERLIEEKRKEGVFLTVLGYGMGNYKDSKMEILADKGNGNYAYIDNIREAQKVLVNEFGGTLFTIAKDVKLQIEFNPAKVKAYRLIGYENRALKDEDFNNDKKDAGELGSGHTVTALYEIIPVGVESEFFKIDDLKYQSSKLDASAKNSNELMTVKFRYKEPDEETSKLIVDVLRDEMTPSNKTSENFRWSAAVAGFGMLLRDSEYLRNYSYDQVILAAGTAKGEDKDGYRIEFINMVKSVGLLASR